MNKKRVEEIVLGVFRKYTDRQNIDVNFYLFSDMELDSLDLVEVIMKIEDTLDIFIDNDMFDNCKIVQDVIDVFFDLIKDM